MSYKFINFVLTHPKAVAFRKYIKGAPCAEEHFYITLFHLPEAPVGKAPSHPVSSTSIWMYSASASLRCNASQRHSVCIAEVGTMASIRHESAFFFNKYYEHLDHVIMDCAEERIVHRNKFEYFRDCSKRIRSLV